MSRRPIFPLLAALAALMLVIAGCGSSGSSGNGVASKSAGEILAASKTAADSASSVHVSGTLMGNGTPITLNLSLLAGRGGRGQISESGLSLQLIVVGDTIYIKGSPSFYRHFGGSAAAQLFQGKWLKAPISGGELASFAGLTNFRQLLDQTLASHGTLAKGGTSTISGQPVIELHDTARDGSLFIATTGKPYPVEIVKHGSEAGHISFSGWNRPVPLAPPAGAIDLSQLEHAGTGR